MNDIHFYNSNLKSPPHWEVLPQIAIEGGATRETELHCPFTLQPFGVMIKDNTYKFLHSQ